MAFSNGNDAGTPMSEINVTPLVDVMLVLLIIFMITAPLMSHKTKVELPEANYLSRDVDKPTPTPPITIAVTSQGNIFYNDEQVTLELIEARLQLVLQTDSAARRENLTAVKQLEAQIQASTRASQHLGAYRWEAAKLIDLVDTPMALIEVAARLEIPIGVTRVLVSDLVDDGAVVLHVPQKTQNYTSLLERVLDGVRNL